MFLSTGIDLLKFVYVFLPILACHIFLGRHSL